jgi:hypothetical protein
MTIRLYQQSRSEAHRLANIALQRLGFTTCDADLKEGMIRTRKELNKSGQTIFFDVKVSGQKHGVSLLLFSNSFSQSTCTFVADAVSEELFLEALHDLLRIQPPDNPMKLNFNDYAFAVGF